MVETGSKGREIGKCPFRDIPTVTYFPSTNPYLLKVYHLSRSPQAGIQAFKLVRLQRTL
jgi:hypothetical protein